MKVKIIAFLSVFCLATGGFASAWENTGFSVQSEGTEEDKKTLVIQDESGANSFKVLYVAEITAKQAKKIADVAAEFFGWKSFPISQLRFLVNDKSIEVVLIPQKIEIDSVDYMSYFPSGLFFYVDFNDYILRYDFRMNYKGNLFLRVKGIYVNEQELRKQITGAVQNPKAFIKTGDIEYLANKLEDLEAKLAMMSYEMNELKVENFKYKCAMVTLQNRGFFMEVYPVSIENIAKVVDFKKANPAMSKDAIVKEMEKQGVKVSGNEVFLILSIFFNEHK